MSSAIKTPQVLILLWCLMWFGCSPSASTSPPPAGGPRSASVKSPVSTVDQVRRMVSAQFGADFDKVRSGTSLADLAADELDFVELIMELEDTFSISISDDAAEEMAGTTDWQQGMKNVTVGKLARLVDQLKNN